MVVAFEPHSDDVALFCAFLAQQHAARVVTVLEGHVQAARGLPISQQQRLRENAAAMQELGLTLEQWAFRDDRPDWDAIEHQMVALDRREKPELVLAPAVELGGHEHHNLVGEAARFVFGVERVQPYLTYRRGYGRTEGVKVGFTCDQLARKLRALACFRSQMCEPSTQPWFIGDQAEYTSSGARSGMQPSRSERGAGAGTVGPITLACRHTTHDAPALSNPDRWWCVLCAEFVAKKGAR